MHSTDPRTHAAIEAALGVVMAGVTAVVDRTIQQTGQPGAAPAATVASAVERDQLLAGQYDLRRNVGAFHRAFRQELREQVSKTLTNAAPQPRRTNITDWQSLSLVDDTQVEEKLESDRVGQQIADACEWELREVGSYFAGLMGMTRYDADHNPLRAAVIGAALCRGIEAACPAGPPRQALTRELGHAVSRAMPECYRRIMRDLQGGGVQPVALTVRTVEGPGSHQVSGYVSGYASLHGQLDSRPGALGPTSTASQRLAQSQFGLPGVPAPAAVGLAASAGAVQSDVQLMDLLRRLTVLAAQGSGGGQDPGPTLPAGLHPSGFETQAGIGYPAYAGPVPAGMMAPNLIRAHRDELMRASDGRLDHLVIDVVASLFDQVLSDPRVPPQLARQIARLQLPVLRVALRDTTFFSSRRHPVRRFVNRIASLALAFDDFDEGAGREFLERVRALVQEIIDGDFDQIALYAAKLAELESFIGQQTQGRVEATPAAVTLEDKESELRLQQRYTMQLQGVLAPIPMPAFLRDFLAQVWSQALLVAARRDGITSERSARYRRTGRDLVLSVQPKGAPQLRKKFLMQLPGLMKDLNDGLATIGWAEIAKKEFFGKLLPAHAESLKQPPMTELDYNLLAKQIEAIFNAGVPRAESLTPADDLSGVASAELEGRFTPEEAQQVNLIAESAVDWDGKVDIDLGAAIGDASAAEAEAEAEAEASENTPLALGLGLDINLDLAPSEPPEPTKGATLFDHIRLGMPYQMHLKDKWRRVRLAYVSPARSFFIFSTGHKQQETISMTARVLSRMCETGRMRAVESAYLLERATVRARKQLAALRVPSTTH